MLMIANAPLLLTRFIMPILSVATGIGMVTAGISIGVIISKQIDTFTTTVIVLQAPANITLNRFIEPIELPLYSDAVGTMNLIVEDIKQVLKTKFGDKFVNVELTNFSAIPIVTSNNEKISIVKRDDPGAVSKKYNEPSSDAVSMSPSNLDPDNTTNTTLFDDCTATSVPLDCENIQGSSILAHKCVNQTEDITDCVYAQTDILACVENKLSVTNCSGPTDDIINGTTSKVTILLKCYNGSDTTTDSLTSTVTILLNCYNRSVTTTDSPTSSTTSTTSTTSSTRSTTTSTISTTSSTTSTTTSTTSTINTIVPTTVIPTSTISTAATLLNNSTNQCKPNENATTQSSIIPSTMLIYFVVKKGESISVSDIIDALSNLNPSITLLTVCKQTSSQFSSFNRTLSKVEPPTEVNIDLNVLASQSSIPSSLQDSVDAAALEAIAAAEAAGLFSDKTITTTTTTTESSLPID